MSRIKQIEKRLDYLKVEVVHADRLDGWTLKGHKDEIKRLIQELKEIQEKINDKDNS
tara:strand:- start:1114 stop:1284 length:171 start_codon:yes stop_codon:yes gene_type:complete